MKTVIMSRQMFDYLTEAKAIRKSGMNYLLGRSVVIVDRKRTGYILYPSEK